MERIKKENLMSSGIKIVAVDEKGGSPFDILEGIQFLKSGGFISLTGDRVWRKAQRTVPVLFLNHQIDLPETPYVIALLSGAPLFVFFASRSGKNGFRFSISKPIYVRRTARRNRKKVIAQAAQTYSDLLERHLRQHPFEWYHFEPFIKHRKQ